VKNAHLPPYSLSYLLKALCKCNFTYKALTNDASTTMLMAGVALLEKAMKTLHTKETRQQIRALPDYYAAYSDIYRRFGTT
jgi:hypothetical protein